jgi:hypothetical protein
MLILSASFKFLPDEYKNITLYFFKKILYKDEMMNRTANKASTICISKPKIFQKKEKFFGILPDHAGLVVHEFLEVGDVTGDGGLFVELDALLERGR